MPPSRKTRSSRAAESRRSAPARAQETPPRRTRRTRQTEEAVESSASDAEQPYMPSPMATQDLRDPIRHRSMSLRYNVDLDVEAVPDSSRQTPNRSFAQTQSASRRLSQAGSIRSNRSDRTFRSSRTDRTDDTARPDYYSPQVARHRRHIALRPSLGAQQLVGVMTVEKRAEVVADVAGDCLIKLLGWNDGNEEQESASGAWNSLESIRRTYIFAPHAPPFPDFAEVEEALDPQVRTINNLERMRDALQLSNLATWVYTIIAPDQAGDLLRDLDTGADDPFQVRSRGKGVGSDQVIDRVRRRNEILVMAWKNFWSVVVPVEKRDSESALTVWLDFATFIIRNWQRPTLEPLAEPSDDLPPIDRVRYRNLFSPSSVTRYGQWTELDDEDDDVREVKERVKARWTALVTRRQAELRDKRPSVLDRQFVWDQWRQEVLAYVENEAVLAVRPAEREASITPVPEKPRVDMLTAQGEEADDEGGDGVTEESDAESRPEDRDVFDEDVDMDVMLEVAREMEREAGRELGDDLQSEDEMPDMDMIAEIAQEMQEEVEVAARRDAPLESQEEEEEDVERPAFRFAARQEDAEQIDFEETPRPLKGKGRADGERPDDQMGLGLGTMSEQLGEGDSLDGLDSSDEEVSPEVIDIAEMPAQTQVPTQAALIRRHDTNEPLFDEPDEAEDVADRALLIHPRVSRSVVAPEPISSSPSPTPPRTPDRVQQKTEPRSVNAPRPTPVESVRFRAPTRAPDPPRLIRPDLYMVDENGNPLVFQDDYVLPPDYKPTRPFLHGRKEGQTSNYSRLMGTLKWTEREALLLYRTIQQVPWSQRHPCQVVWYLHGEAGALSSTLQMRNPQHMKDKMRTIVQTRRNNDRPVQGRARAFAPVGTEIRDVHDEEQQNYWVELEAEEARIGEMMRERAVAEQVERERQVREEERRRRKRRRLDGEEEEEDELDSEDDEEEEEEEEEQEEEPPSTPARVTRGSQARTEVPSVEPSKRPRGRPKKDAQAGKPNRKGRKARDPENPLYTPKNRQVQDSAPSSTPRRSGRVAAMSGANGVNGDETGGTDATPSGRRGRSARVLQPADAPAGNRRVTRSKGAVESEVEYEDGSGPTTRRRTAAGRDAQSSVTIDEGENGTTRVLRSSSTRGGSDADEANPPVDEAIADSSDRDETQSRITGTRKAIRGKARRGRGGAYGRGQRSERALPTPIPEASNEASPVAPEADGDGGSVGGSDASGDEYGEEEGQVVRDEDGDETLGNAEYVRRKRIEQAVRNGEI